MRQMLFSELKGLVLFGMHTTLLHFIISFMHLRVCHIQRKLILLCSDADCFSVHFDEVVQVATES